MNIPAHSCQIGDSIQVNFVDCPDFVPNIFTPNSDGLNDRFVVGNIENRKWKLEVYNRWGNLVYLSEDYQNNWNGEGLTTGMYYYKLSTPSLKKVFKGWLQILK